MLNSVCPAISGSPPALLSWMRYLERQAAKWSGALCKTSRSRILLLMGAGPSCRGRSVASRACKRSRLHGLLFGALPCFVSLPRVSPLWCYPKDVL